MMNKLTANFSLSEFACHDGTPVPEKYISNVTELAKNLQVLRDYLGVKIHINSGYRTKEYNKEVRGEKNSRHLLAMAADIVAEGKTAAEVRHAILYLISINKMQDGGIGFYDSFIHYDISNPRRWDKRTEV